MKYDPITLSYAQAQERRVLHLSTRVWQEELSEDRNEFSRDYARIIYSSSFLRLQGKMQLLGIQHTEFFRNRLTHSLTVAQVAREIAANLELKYPVVAEVASLAHDLGNPPFGHYGEKILGGLAKDIGGFEGNAQTLRILTCLEKKHYEYGGLNLTLRTLLSVIKYFRKYENGANKKFIYDSDFDLILNKLEEHQLGNEPNTIDMQIMDLADEIAYAAHDLEDCLKLGYFTIDELLNEFKHHEKYSVAYKTFKELVESSQKFANRGTRFETSEEFSFLFRRRLTSLVVNKLVSDIALSAEKTKLQLKHHNLLSSGLKELTFKAVKRKTAVQLYEKMGEKIIKGLFTVFSDDKFNKELFLLPAEYRKYESGNETERQRNIIDYISGMMDSFAMKEYEKYFGPNSLEKQYFVE
ncbi:MAG TPA: dNTP triphosphohydrolase [Pyrinomonadaceae bacterium]|jgi:dGTPase